MLFSSSKISVPFLNGFIMASMGWDVWRLLFLATFFALQLFPVLVLLFPGGEGRDVLGLLFLGEGCAQLAKLPTHHPWEGATNQPRPEIATQCTEAANLAFLAIDNAVNIVGLTLSESAILCEYCEDIVQILCAWHCLKVQVIKRQIKSWLAQGGLVYEFRMRG